MPLWYVYGGMAAAVAIGFYMARESWRGGLPNWVTAFGVGVATFAGVLAMLDDLAWAIGWKP